MRPAVRAGLALIVLAGLLSLGYWLRPHPSKAVAQAQCPDLTQACVVTLGTARLTVQADHTPSTLKPFHLSVTGVDGEAAVRFGMAGMEMGPIAYPLKPGPTKRLEADVVLPFCVQGRRDWWMRLTLPQGDVEVAFEAAK